MICGMAFSQLTNWKGPVPIGFFAAHSGPFFLHAAGETMRPIVMARLLITVLSHSERLICTRKIINNIHRLEIFRTACFRSYALIQVPFYRLSVKIRTIMEFDTFPERNDDGILLHIIFVSRCEPRYWLACLVTAKERLNGRGSEAVAVSS